MSLSRERSGYLLSISPAHVDFVPVDMGAWWPLPRPWTRERRSDYHKQANTTGKDEDRGWYPKQQECVPLSSQEAGDRKSTVECLLTATLAIVITMITKFNKMQINKHFFLIHMVAGLCVRKSQVANHTLAPMGFPKLWRTEASPTPCFLCSGSAIGSCHGYKLCNKTVSHENLLYHSEFPDLLWETL